MSNSRPIIQESKFQDNQYNYNAAKENGYSSKTSFLTGKLVDPKDAITWKGNHGNSTYTHLEEVLFENDYTSLKIRTNKTEDMFLLPHGNCKKLLGFNFTAIERVQNRLQSLLLMVDPNKVNSLRIKEMENARIEFGPTNPNSPYFTSSNYDLAYTLHDKSIHDGYSCFDYEKLNSSYGNCVEGKVKEYYLKSIGCLPPWLRLEEYVSMN